MEKKIIKGRIYNTDTSYLKREANYVEEGEKVDYKKIEKLFQKRNGEYFIFGICHTFDKSGQYLDTLEWITPMTDIGVMNWENKVDQRIFGDLEEKVKKTGREVVYYRDNMGMIKSKDKEEMLNS